MIDELIASYGLTPHPEGGYFKETYRAAATLPGTARSVCTAIFYLLPWGQRSRLHRIDADELWHFYQGDALTIVELVPGAPARQTRLSAQHPQYLVKANTWFGAMPAEGSRYSLVGCTVSPGFEFAHFELGSAQTLCADFPLAQSLITALT
jgi:predicted cupin superfamily sugar epimerase